jgi:dTDP-4-dehydrorhamnose reductase
MRLLAPQSKHTWLMTDVAELDITSQEAVASYVNNHDIRLIVNCAGYTNVDRAESDEETARRVNADAVAIMAQAMKEVDGTLIHISTDYVFGGNKNNTPCSEEEPVNPTGAYGRTKLAGERAAEACRHIIFRTSWLYSEYGKNFLLTMLNLTATRPELNVVFDQVGTPTYAGDLARAIFDIIEEGSYMDHQGIFNFSNEGVCSWFDFTKEIARQSGQTDCNIMPCHSDEFPSPVKRPAYSVLDKTKYKQTFHRIVPYWTESLTTCINNINNNR